MKSTPQTVEEQIAAAAARAKAAQTGPLGKRQTEIISETETTSTAIETNTAQQKTLSDAEPILCQLRDPDNGEPFALALIESAVTGKPVPAKTIAAGLELLFRQSYHALAITHLRNQIEGLKNLRRPLYQRAKELESELAEVQREILGESPKPKQAPPAQTSDTADFERLSTRLGGSTRRLPV